MSSILYFGSLGGSLFFSRSHLCRGVLVFKASGSMHFQIQSCGEAFVVGLWCTSLPCLQDLVANLEKDSDLMIARLLKFTQEVSLC